jgi:Lysyl oxidase
MLRAVILVRLLPVVATIMLTTAALAMADRPSGAAGARLPDLVQELPSDLEITVTGPRERPVYRLGFQSAVSNIGRGPLVISGRRSGADVATMTADQVVERDGAPLQVVPDVGRLRYVVSPDHRHWHLLGFDRYQLRRAGRKPATVSDRKTGFCLGDRYPVLGRRLGASPGAPSYTSRCGLGEPQLAGIQEGISVGYGDDYAATLEGQYLRLTGLRPGRYVLVHRVNADRRLRELRYGNNAASLLVKLRWSGRQPRVRVLRACPVSASCDRPPGARRR